MYDVFHPEIGFVQQAEESTDVKLINNEGFCIKTTVSLILNRIEKRAFFPQCTDSPYTRSVYADRPRRNSWVTPTDLKINGSRVAVRG